MDIRVAELMIAILGAVFFCSPAFAFFECRPFMARDTLIERLAKVGEDVVGTGVYPPNAARVPGTFEIWSNPETGEWTAVTNSRLDGKWISCPITAGHNWTQLAPTEGGET